MRETVAQRIAASLRDEGVEIAFGLPGGEVTELIEAMRGAGIRFVLTKHEASAAFAAQTYGLLTGSVGVSVTTLGPGATNVVTGVANAYLDRAPLLAISANLHSARQSLATHQKLSLSALFAPVTKAQIAFTAGHVERTVRRAVDLAMSERPGPVFLELSSDLAAAPADEPDLRVPAARSVERIVGSVDGADALRDFAARLSDTSRPFLVVGWAAARRALRDGGRLTGAIRSLASSLRAPVGVTPKAKGVIAEDDPWFLGVLEGVQTDSIFAEMQRADAIVCVGMDGVELDRWWDFPAPVFGIAEAYDTDHAIPQVCQVIGRMDDSVRALADVLRAGAQSAADPSALRSPEAIGSWRAERLSPRRAGAAGSLEAHEAVTALRRAAPRDTRMVTDVGMHKLVASQYWQSYAAGEYFLSNGLSSMGFGIPTAMAVQLASPSAPVVALVGDGGLAMTLGEIETLAREGIGIVIVVLVDESLMLIRQNQERKGYPAVGVDFSNPDFRAIADAFHVLGLRAESQHQVEEAFAEALRYARARHRPALIEVPVARRQY